MKGNSTKPAHATHVRVKETKVKPKAKPAKKNEAAHGLRDLFIFELKDIYWVEKALTKAIPKMIENATTAELINALTGHLKETIEQVTRLEKVFYLLEEKAVAIKCEAMTGIIKETVKSMKETKKGEVRDAAIILAGQKVEHYEIAAYGSLCSFAKTLRENDIADELEKTLNEEKGADKKLSEIVASSLKKIENNNENSIDVLNNLLEINNDRIEGYSHARKETNERDLKKLFSKFEEMSHQFKQELTAEVQKLGGSPIEGTRTSGKLFRAWMDIKAALTNKDRKGILNSCEFGEDVAVKNYEDALSNNNIESNLYKVINKQYTEITTERDKIKDLHDEQVGTNSEINKLKTKSEKKDTRKQIEANVIKHKPGVSEVLRDLFLNELKDIFWAEKALTKAIPKMINNATSSNLIEALTRHLKETTGQVKRLEKVFSLLREKAVAIKCEGMTGLITEAQEVINKTEKGEVRDAGIILSAQKVEHYEIAAYGSLFEFAKTLGEDDAAALLEETLKEEREIDEDLSALAESSINIEAAKNYVDNNDTMVAIKTKIK